ncbi:MAG: Fis family transcriptional regulator, partial [Anaerolineae bacterium SM23_84]
MVEQRDCILVVEDEPRLLRLVREVLQAVGYRVVAAGDGRKALEVVALERPDLILLDILLPRDMDGYEVCRRVREFSSVPVIMLTAKARESDKLKGFEVGADDYLIKPFSSKELVARVRAVLRRSKHPEEVKADAEFGCGEVRVNFAQRRVFVGGQEVALTPTEYALLRELALNADCVMLHQQLLSAVWGPEYVNDVDYLRAYIRYLRRKIEPDPA